MLTQSIVGWGTVALGFTALGLSIGGIFKTSLRMTVTGQLLGLAVLIINYLRLAGILP